MDHWLTTSGHNTCPIDDQVVYEKKKIRQGPRTSLSVRVENEVQQPATLSIAGHQISQVEQEQEHSSIMYNNCAFRYTSKRMLIYRATLPPVTTTKKAKILRGYPVEHTRRNSTQLPPFFSLNAISLSSIHDSERNSPGAIAQSRACPTHPRRRSTSIRRQQKSTQSNAKTFRQALPRISLTKSKIRDMQLALQVSSLRKSQDQVLPSLT